jgi:hypothetical protein
MYTKIDSTDHNWSKWSATGTSDDYPDDEFTVRITSGATKNGIVYKIRKGGADQGLFNCKHNAKAPDGVTTFTSAAAELEPDSGLVVARDFRASFLAAQKEVSIAIDLEDLRDLKAANYRLCFAKKVGAEAFNVVWQSYHDYLAFNEFSWIPMYQLFGANRFLDNVAVRVSTNLVDIGLGEQSTLDDAGILSRPKTAGPSTSINLVNDYGKIHPGICQLSTGIDGTEVATPIYVATEPVVTGDASFTPVERVLVWFEQNIETSTMFSNARSKSVQIDLTNVNSATRLYQGGQWSTP